VIIICAFQIYIKNGNCTNCKINSIIIERKYSQEKLCPSCYVNIEESEHGSRMLTLQEGLFCGISSGAAIKIAIDYARKMEKGIMVVVLPDGGEKYINHPIFSPERCLECVHRCDLPTLWTDQYIESIKEWWEQTNK